VAFRLRQLRRARWP